MSKGITRERTGRMLQELFKVLLKHPDGLQARDAIESVARDFDLSEHEKGDYEKGGRRFDKILRFATVDAVKAGWMFKNKGIWSITEDGIRALQRFQDPEKLYAEATRLYRQWRLSNPVVKDVEVEAEDSSAAREAKVTFEEAEERALKEIMSYVESIDPYTFQDLVAALLRGMGYYTPFVAPKGKDGGVDIIAYRDPLGTTSPRIKVQIKHRGTTTGVKEVRELIGVLKEGDVGIFVSTAGFSPDMKATARSAHVHIELIDLPRLIELWQEFYPKLVDEDKARLPIVPIYFLALSE